MTTPDKDGWITYNGGPNPVPGARVDVRFRSGRRVDDWLSEDWDWRVIAAYRVREPAPTPNPLTDALSAVLYRRTERVSFPGQSIVYRNERDCVVIEFFSDDAAADFLAQITPA